MLSWQHLKTNQEGSEPLLNHLDPNRTSRCSSCYDQDSQSHVQAILLRNLRVELLPGSSNFHLYHFGGILQVRLMKAFEAPINCKSFPCLELFVATPFPPRQHWQLPESHSQNFGSKGTGDAVFEHQNLVRIRSKVSTSQTRILKLSVLQVLHLQVS